MISSAPYPLNSAVLVIIAIGVSNVILRAIEFGSAADGLIGLVSFGALAQFVSEIFFHRSFAGNFFPHAEMSQTSEILSSVLGLALLSLLGYLSSLSHQSELQLSAVSEKPEMTAALDDIRREIGIMQRKLGSSHSRQASNRK